MDGTWTGRGRTGRTWTHGTDGTDVDGLDGRDGHGRLGPTGRTWTGGTDRTDGSDRTDGTGVDGRPQNKECFGNNDVDLHRISNVLAKMMSITKKL